MVRGDRFARGREPRADAEGHCLPSDRSMHYVEVQLVCKQHPKGERRILAAWWSSRKSYCSGRVGCGFRNIMRLRDVYDFQEPTVSMLRRPRSSCIVRCSGRGITVPRTGPAKRLNR